MSRSAPASDAPSAPTPLAPTPLLAVHRLREEVAAGHGAATIRVRTLDDLSLAVHPSELVLVQGSVASGLSSMRRALARGHAAAPGTRTRRGTIAAAARDAIVEAWRAPCPAPWPAGRSVGNRTSTVYLLRVRTDAGPADAAALPPPMQASWRDWVYAVRGAGGAVVLFERTGRVSRPASSPPARVRESDAGPGMVRGYTLRDGRLLDAGTGAPTAPRGERGT